MGKWTPNYTDDVLHAKISNLVSGSIRRAAVEKEPSISYENFVTDLETGDSFTASLVDILVKELADRRSRTNDNDRKLIGERTIRSLRTLASNSRSFTQRIGHTHPRRSSARAEHFSAMANPMDLDEEEEEYEAMMDNTTIIEGARVNNELNDAYMPSGWARRNTASPPASEEWPTLPLRSPESASRPWNPATTLSNASLTRQTSIRRPRSRVIDFHEHALRRRSNVRDSMAGSRSDAPESVTEPRESLSTGTVRRFFPFPRARRYASGYPAWPELSDTLSPDSDDARPAYYSAWVNAALDPLQASSDPESREETEFLLRAPRLRLRTAPEQVVSGHASPIDVIPGLTYSLAGGAPAVAEAVTENTSSGETYTSSPRREEQTAFPTDEPVAYPTPGSTENENTA